MGGVITIWSAKSGTTPNPDPWNGTQTFVLRKKQVAGCGVVGLFSTCQSEPGLGETAIHLEGPLSMSSKKWVVVPVFTATSSKVQPVNRSVESSAENLRSEPKRNWSAIGWVTVLKLSGMDRV